MNILTFFSECFAFIRVQFSMFQWTDALDIIMLSALFLTIWVFLQDSRAANLVWGIVALLALWGVSSLINMYAVSYLLRTVFYAGIPCLIIIFQPELRMALEKMGGRPWQGLRGLGEKSDKEMMWKTIEVVCEAASDISRDHMGALIVIERSTKLGDIIRSGIAVDAEPSSFLLRNIFFNKAPMHDGAVVIRNHRICAAGCMLPLSEDTSIDQNLGTRHRAALGMSERSDAIVIVVSEETGIISMAHNRTLTRDYSFQGLKKALSDKLIGSDDFTA